MYQAVPPERLVHVGLAPEQLHRLRLSFVLCDDVTTVSSRLAQHLGSSFLL